MNFKVLAVIASLTLTVGFNFPASAFNSNPANNHLTSKWDRAIAKTKTTGDSMSNPHDSMKKTGDSMGKTGDSMSKSHDSMSKPQNSMSKPNDSMSKPQNSMKKTGDTMKK